ncbi:MAG: polysaccharide pyruvyl transferase family protein [Sedimentisphaerales bacterium]|nr:polysaccharide pyruvyl transferase family protein [Sedimentisphaerales bacterium]
METLQNRKTQVCLLGASLSASNLGLCALAEGSIKCILNRWPNAEITLLGHDIEVKDHRLKLLNQEVKIVTMPIRFCKNLLLPYHFNVLLLSALLLKILPWRRFTNFLCKVNPYVRRLVETDLVFDLTSGDSFSDMYGMRRFIIGWLRRFLVIMYGKNLMMLPQTYGPLERPLTKAMAKYILSHADIIYSRDADGVKVVRSLLNSCSLDRKIDFAPDVAFVLDAQRPEVVDVGLLADSKSNDSIVIGFNISGLLFNGGYTRDNMFGLKVAYTDLIHGIIDLFMKMDSTIMLLVPHVFAPVNKVESDVYACSQVYASACEKYKNRIFITRGEYNQHEIKYVIGTCDFFVGSRMHACIAALSQGIPTVGFAYSTKFRGVFETAGMEQFVTDMRQNTQQEVLATVSQAFQQRRSAAAHLNSVLPGIKKTVLNIFEDVGKP